MNQRFSSFIKQDAAGNFTFAGVLDTYWDEIVRANKWNPQTAYAYSLNYANTVIPGIEAQAKPLSQFDADTCSNIMEHITKNRDYSEQTERHYRHLIKAVVDAGAEHGICEKFLDDTAFGLPETDSVTKKNVYLTRVRKSLTAKQNLYIARKLLTDPETVSGEELGLLLMFFCGLRNNEASAVTYGDLKPLRGHEWITCLYISKSTKLKSVERKISGKTGNSPRILPLPSILSDFLMKRKAFVQDLYDRNMINLEGVDQEHGVDGLIIACHGQKYETSCQADDLGRKARELFETVPGFDGSSLRNTLQVLDLERLNGERDGGVVEKNPTAYLLRHNHATMLFNLGLESHEVQYYIGHDIENTDMVRNDFINPEILARIWEKVEMHPVNQVMKCREQSSAQEYTSGIVIQPCDRNIQVLVKVTAKEPDQEIRINTEDHINVRAVIKRSIKPQPLPSADIVSRMIEVYRKEYSRMDTNHGPIAE